MADEETRILVELDGQLVGFGDSESDRSEARLGEVADAVVKESEAEVLSAVGGGDAELSDVGNVCGDTRTEKHADEGSVAAVAKDPGGRGIEDSATGKADDVVEEAQGSVKGTILVVDS